jgi:hypothetical protein
MCSSFDAVPDGPLTTHTIEFPYTRTLGPVAGSHSSGGTVETWAWVTHPGRKHPLDRPFAFALIRLDGADTGLLHAVDAGSIDRMRTGMRVVARWKDARAGHITDLTFVPEGSA